MFSISDSLYPELFQAADKLAIDTQKKYFLYLRLYLVLLLSAAIISYQWQETLFGDFSICFLFLIALCIFFFLQLKMPDSIWFEARVVAESIKTLIWRWMMHATPYQDENDEHRIHQDLKEIIAQHKELASVFLASIETNEIITQKMNQIRNMKCSERKDYYMQYRIKDQHSWYVRKSEYNRTKGNNWFWISICLHALAIIFLGIRIFAFQYQFPIEIFATAAIFIHTWLQAKKSNQLGIAYSLTANEIATFLSEAESVQTEDKLSNFVVNSENAFSRKHTQYFYKHDVTYY